MAKASFGISSCSSSSFGGGLCRALRMVCRMVVEPALTVYFLFRSSATPTDAKLMIAGSLADLLPLNIVPDLVPDSWLDNYSSLIDILKVVQDNMTPEVEQKVRLTMQGLRLG